MDLFDIMSHIGQQQFCLMFLNLYLKIKLNKQKYITIKLFLGITLQSWLMRWDWAKPFKRCLSSIIFFTNISSMGKFYDLVAQLLFNKGVKSFLDVTLHHKNTKRKW